MPSSPSQTIFILFLVAVGFLVGAVLATWLSGRDKASKAQKQSTARPEVKPVTGLNPEQYEEVVSLWRARADGRLVVLLGGKPVEVASQLPEGKRKQMELTAREWLVWMGLLPAQAKPQPIPAPVVPKPEASQPSSPASRPVPVQNASGQVLAAPAPAGGAAVEPKRVGSIVQQINDILQEKLRTSGLLNRGVSLMEDPRQGVIVMVGLQRFVGIDAVTDPEIKALIKASVAEWERQTEKGTV